jgi:hydroxymethylbilane synthase
VTDRIRIGTRGSALALWQAHHIRDRLLTLHPGLEVELEVIVTRGDQILDRPLALVGGKGLFVREIEVALLDGTIDLAVHSLKDMPTEQPPGLELRAYPERASAFDVLCARADGVTLDTLPQGARVGTASLRRSAQLRRLRPDLEIVSIRGNVQTRLGKRESEALDAVVLAEAGLRRLDIWEDGRFSVLPFPAYAPAPAQGCLAIETREGDARVATLIDPLDHEDTRLAIEAERACLEALGGDCHTPFCAYARRRDDELSLFARLLDAAPLFHERGGLEQVEDDYPEHDPEKQSAEEGGRRRRNPAFTGRCFLFPKGEFAAVFHVRRPFSLR